MYEVGAVIVIDKEQLTFDEHDEKDGSLRA